MDHMHQNGVDSNGKTPARKRGWGLLIGRGRRVPDQRPRRYSPLLERASYKSVMGTDKAPQR
jgi:hypothetical protein